MAPTVLAEGTILFFAVLLPILYLIFKHFRLSSPLPAQPTPPGPYPWPIIGNILHVGKKPHVSLTQLAQSYGSLISLRLGTQNLVVASSPAAAMEILKTHDRLLSARYIPRAIAGRKSELNNISMGWAFECHDRWKYLRTICRTELFSGKAIESQACLRSKRAMEMVAFLGRKEGKVVKVAEVVFATVLNMLTSVLMSKDFISLEDEIVDGGIKRLLRAAIDAAYAPSSADFFPILGGMDLQNLWKKLQEACARIYSLWEDIIKERRERKGSDVTRERDFMDALIENDFTDEQTNQLLLELLTAGTDTTSSTIEWALAELIKNPESMKKVQEEITKEIKDDAPNESSLPQLHYLQACVKETLRLHPPAPFLLPHCAPNSCKVMNYTIPENSQILVNVWAIGRDSMYWKDPLMFKPERFLNSSLDFKGNDFEFLPFGAGRRICPGLPMAAKLVSLVLASLVQFFDWSLPHGSNPKELDMTEKFGVTLHMEQPLCLIPKVRK